MGAHFGAHQRIEAAGKLALGGIGMAMIELLDEDQRQHPVAEKFQALVVGILGGGGAGMGERHGEEIGVLKVIAEPILNRCCRIGFQGTSQVSGPV